MVVVIWFRAGINPEGRLFNPSLAGGALLDGDLCGKFSFL